MIMGLPESIEPPVETKSEANDMVPIQMSKEKNNGRGKSLERADERKKEVEGDVDDDVALTFPQRVSSSEKIVSPLWSILFELQRCWNTPQYRFFAFL
jgi:hypothetical protein